MKAISTISSLIAFCAISSIAQTKDSSLCTGLESLELPNAKVTGAAIVPAASFPLRAGVDDNASSLDLPAYCRVTVTIKPKTDSDIGVEVWLPVAEWNEKLLGTGNVNWCGGGINRLQMALGLREHYATAGTDRGHQSCTPDSSFAARPDKLAEFGYLAVHEMTAKAKALTAAYYAMAPKHSYFTGGSSGGGEALMEVQRYPEDYDGVVAGAPTNNWTHLMATSIWNAQIAGVLTRDKLSLLHQAVLAACDSPDAIGLLDDPRQCGFEPEALRCPTGEDSPKCLTQSQIEAVKKIYKGPADPRTGAAIYPGLECGSELGWPLRSPNQNHVDYFRYVVHADPKWDWHAFDLSRDVALADQKGQHALNAVDPDLRRFAQRGGKLILFHGWEDSALAPRNTVNYYESVSATMGKQTRDAIRLFMVPRMSHFAGRGTHQFNALAALERWVEAGIPPDRITAQRVTGIVGLPGTGVITERPLCPYPEVARWKGSGSRNDAANFECALPVAGNQR
jgi:feruloyl esterase